MVFAEIVGKPIHIFAEALWRKLAVCGRGSKSLGLSLFVVFAEIYDKPMIIIAETLSSKLAVCRRGSEWVGFVAVL